ncbi:MAG: TonB-dependent receptor [Ferruginibacter sp.]
MKVNKAVLLLLCFFGLGISQVLAQTIQVSGKVTNKANGEPLVGATVTIKGTTQATTTDSQGGFSILVPQKGTVLIVTNVNMRSVQITIKDDSPIAVNLEPSANTLEEVIVNVGYGTQKKSVVTGAISRITARDLDKVPNGGVGQALQGRVSGLTIAANSGQPGSPSTIRVRGITSFNGNDPLWVVDGVIVDNGGIGFINQSDIESIEVLKDAASAAIYGTRAARGVILITTKKGKAGRLSVNYNGFYGTASPAKRLDLLNATQYATLINEKTVAGGGDIVFPDLGSLGTGTDWQKEIFNTHAGRFNHQLSLSGGNERSTFYISFGLEDREGIVLPQISHYTKKNIRINSTHKISTVFTFGESIAYAHGKSQGIGNTNSEYGGPLSSAINLDPTTAAVIYDPTMAAGAPYSSNPVLRDNNGNPYGISKYVGQEMTNPKAYALTKLGGYNWSDDIVGNIYVEANATKHIKIRSSLGGKLAYYGGQNYNPVYYLNPTNGVAINSLSKNDNNVLNYIFENTVTFNQKFGGHDINLIIGQSALVEGKGGGSSVNLFNLPIDSYEDASFNFDIPQSSRTSGAYTNTLLKQSSILARLNYNYQERYLVTGIVRRDRSTRFGSEHKTGTFPSFSVGWVPTKENFWTANKYVKSLKIRGGYGIVGNDEIGNFGYTSLVSGGYNYTLGNAGNITTGYSPVTLSNSGLAWEETSQLNVGFDAQVLNNFNLAFDIYKKRTTGILQQFSVPGYVGVSQNPVGNVADMNNTGIELELGYRKQIGQLNFNISGNLATVKNEVTYVNRDTNFIGGGASFQSMGTVTRTQVGQAYNSWFGFQTAGIFQNTAEVNAYVNKDGGMIQPNAVPGDFRWVDNNGDGKIDGKDQTFLGSSIPKLTFGITLNFEYKGFDLMVFGQGATGNKIFQGLRRLDITNANYQTKALSRWTGEGTSNDYPRLTTNDVNGNFTSMSNFYLEKGDYFRLKIVQLGYSFNNISLFKKAGVSRLHIYLTAENLATLTKYTGYDPEIGGGVFGVDKGYYPQARSFIAGVQLGF